MHAMVICLQDEKDTRLKRLARSRGISLNKLIKEFSIEAIAESDIYKRIQIATSNNDTSCDLKAPDKQKTHFIERAGY